MQNAIWEKIRSMQPFPPLYGDAKTDVLIIGGGLTGLLCAHRLKSQGVDCMVIEADRVGSGTTGRTTGKITSQHGLIYQKLLRTIGEEKARAYWEIQEKALREYRTLSARMDFDFETKDNYIYSVGNRNKLEQELDALNRIGIHGEFTEETELPFPVAGAVRFRNQGQFHPLKFLNAIGKDLPIYENTAAREFIGNRVVTDRGTITAEKTIVGTHFPILNKHGAYFLKLYQSRSYVIGLERGAQLSGMYLDEAQEGLSFRNQGELLLVGGEDHRTGKKSCGWSRLEAFAGKYYPRSNIVSRWAAQDCMSLDEIPYIGRYGLHTENLYVATGFNKWGMTSAMAAAMILTDLVRGKDNPYAAVFSPQRSMVKPQLLVNGFESTVHLLKPTKPRCPHMGCALTWNGQEHSWDCPCHGSRFDGDGTLLENPATGNLKRNRSS